MVALTSGVDELPDFVSLYDQIVPKLNSNWVFFRLHYQLAINGEFKQQENTYVIRVIQNDGRTSIEFFHATNQQLKQCDKRMKQGVVYDIYGGSCKNTVTSFTLETELNWLDEVSPTLLEHAGQNTSPKHSDPKYNEPTISTAEPQGVTDKKSRLALPPKTYDVNFGKAPCVILDFAQASSRNEVTSKAVSQSPQWNMSNYILYKLGLFKTLIQRLKTADTNPKVILFYSGSYQVIHTQITKLGLDQLCVIEIINPSQMTLKVPIVEDKTSTTSRSPKMHKIIDSQCVKAEIIRRKVAGASKIIIDSAYDEKLLDESYEVIPLAYAMGFKH